MPQISQLKAWVNLEVLTHTDLNAEIAQLINTINALGGTNWAAAGVENLPGTKVDVNTNESFLREHTAAGGHSAFANNNADKLFVTNGATPESQIAVTFDRATVFNLDNPSTRLRKLIQSTAAIAYTADITVEDAVNGRESGSTEGAEEWWNVWIIYNSTEETGGAFLTEEANDTIAEITFPTDYDYALLVGKVYNNADQDFNVPLPIAGAGYANIFAPQFSQFATGKFTGSGASKSIVGAGFPPDMVIVNNATNGATITRFRLRGESAFSAVFGMGGATETGITSLDADGFTVATDDDANENGILMEWMAFRISQGVS